MNTPSILLKAPDGTWVTRVGGSHWLAAQSIHGRCGVFAVTMRGDNLLGIDSTHSKQPRANALTPSRQRPKSQAPNKYHVLGNCWHATAPGTRAMFKQAPLGCCC